MSYITNDYGTVAALELCAVVLAYTHPLDKPEGCTKPGDRLTHIRVDQYGDDRRRRDGSVELHAWLRIIRPPYACPLAADLDVSRDQAAWAKLVCTSCS